MDMEQTGTGRMHLSLGPVERKIVSVAGAIIGLVFLWFANTIVTTKEAVQSAATQESVNRISEQQAVMTARLADLSLVMSDIPSMKTEIAQIKMRTEQNRNDIEDLQKMEKVR